VLEYIIGKDKKLRACVEYHLVNEKGQWDDKGDFVYISDTYINPGEKDVVVEIAKRIIRKCPKARFSYYKRERKYGNTKLHIIHRAKWLKYILKYGKKER
jgi:hypothetical protein